MTWTLKGKATLLSGGSKGIGKTLAVALAKTGSHVAVIGKTMSPHPDLAGILPETVSAIESVGRSGLAVQADVRNHQQVEMTDEHCASYFGGRDFMIHNAGSIWSGALAF
jgi:NAD(P)-dependent dehydrogenase (short-subunit alcohol dehydrogenase family)